MEDSSVKYRFDWKQFRQDFWNKPSGWHTQAEKAKKCDVSQAKISRILNDRGSYSLNVSEFARCCNFMGTEPQKYFRTDLFGD